MKINGLQSKVHYIVLYYCNLQLCKTGAFWRGSWAERRISAITKHVQWGNVHNGHASCNAPLSTKQNLLICFILTHSTILLRIQIFEEFCLHPFVFTFCKVSNG